MHFCVLTARVYVRRSVPRKMGLNLFIPALVNSSVGSSCGTTGDDGTNVWPCRWTKKSMNCWRIWAEVMVKKPAKGAGLFTERQNGQGMGRSSGDNRNSKHEIRNKRQIPKEESSKRK